MSAKRYRKKPVVVTAEQFTKEMDDHKKAPPDGVICPFGVFYIPTLEGDMRVDIGDWIITGVKGEKYPCQDDIFQMTYEPVED